jgi:lysine-specific permease
MLLAKAKGNSRISPNNHSFEISGRLMASRYATIHDHEATSTVSISPVGSPAPPPSPYPSPSAVHDAIHDDLAPGTEVKRSLKKRHLAMIAIGGGVGTGLFLASGEAISGGGPGSVICSFAILGIVVYFLMAGLGEVATYCPMAGSFSAFSERYVDAALGFASGWNECVARSITLTVEVLSAGMLIQFWMPRFPTWVWETAIFVFVFVVNAFTVRSYGEIEFWTSLLKVVAVGVFTLIGILRIFGAIGEAAYFRSFVYGDGPFINGFYGFLNAFLIAGFSCLGSELVGMTAAESADPGKDIPTAVHQVIWRILIFYVFSMAVLCCLLRYDNPNLLGASGDSIVESPFTIVLQQANIPGAEHFINAIILVSVISTANSVTFNSSRMLYSLSMAGKAPAIFSRTFASGIPFWSLVATTLLAIVIYVISKFVSNFYSVLVDALSVAGFVNWFAMAISHFRFRRAYVAQGHSVGDLRYKAVLFPIGPLFVMAVCIFIAVSHGIGTFVRGDYGEAVTTYSGLIIIAALYFGFKIARKSKIIPLAEISLKSPLLRESEEIGEPAQTLDIAADLL